MTTKLNLKDINFDVLVEIFKFIKYKTLKNSLQFINLDFYKAFRSDILWSYYFDNPSLTFGSSTFSSKTNNCCSIVYYWIDTKKDEIKKLSKEEGIGLYEAMLSKIGFDNYQFLLCKEKTDESETKNLVNLKCYFKVKSLVSGYYYNAYAYRLRMKNYIEDEVEFSIKDSIFTYNSLHRRMDKKVFLTLSEEEQEMIISLIKEMKLDELKVGLSKRKDPKNVSMLFNFNFVMTTHDGHKTHLEKNGYIGNNSISQKQYRNNVVISDNHKDPLYQIKDKLLDFVHNLIVYVNGKREIMKKKKEKKKNEKKGDSGDKGDDEKPEKPKTVKELKDLMKKFLEDDLAKQEKERKDEEEREERLKKEEEKRRREEREELERARANGLNNDYDSDDYYGDFYDW